MKKPIYLLLFLFTIVSCTTIKQLSNQKITTTITCSKNDFEERMIYIKAKIDDKEENFLFDTGATMAVITDSSSITNIASKEFGNFGTITGADKNSIDLKTFTAKFESDLFNCKDKAFAYVPRKSTKCQKNEKYKGIIGLDVFFNKDAILQIDFTNKKICNIERKEINNLIKNDYFEIKSQCKSKHIFIFLSIEEKEYKFKLDTGFSGSLVIPFSSELNFDKFKNITFEGEMLRTISSYTSGIDSYFENVPVSIGNINCSSIIQVSQSLKVQNIGMRFIKGFDWIIDYNNNKVYVKRNLNKIEENFNKNVFHYQASVHNDKLFVSTKQKQLQKFKISDEIISVNKQKVSSENICEIQDLLNSTYDWETLEIEIISANK